jgi:hypothetical protein
MLKIPNEILLIVHLPEDLNHTNEQFELNIL